MMMKSGNTNIIEGSESANILLHRGTHFEIIEALYAPMSQWNLLSFKDICSNVYHMDIILRQLVK